MRQSSVQSALVMQGSLLQVLTVLPLSHRILLVVAGLQFVSFSTLAVLAAAPVPVFDTLNITHGYVADGLSWSWLLQLHNQHQIILPRLLLVADLAVTGGHVQIFSALGLIAWIGVFLIAALQMIRSLPKSPWLPLGCALLAIALFRAFLLESIILNNGFNYPMTAIFAVSAFALAARVEPARPLQPAAWLAAMAALSSSLCLLNGALALLIAAGVAVLRSRSMFAVTPFMLGAAIAAALYLPEIVPGSPQISLDAGQLLQALLNAFGAPWVLKVGVEGQIVGLIVILVALFCLAVVLRSQFSPVDALAAALMLFGLGSILLAAIGRPELSEHMGAVGRYALWSALVHAGIILTAMHQPLVLQWLGRPSLRVAVLAVAALLMVEQAGMARVYLNLGHEIQVAADTLQAGERSETAFVKLGVDPAYGRAVYDLYAARGLYGFR
ncbi:hypothetical protein [Ferrovibrio terrae]|uniref:hypothetical protein n=1 Tax=Ferrovibrio terrae TaxID=2594003 RepID=UPI003137BEF6